MLLEFLIRAGSEEIVAATWQHVSQVDALTRYHYVDDDGHDHGHNGLPPSFLLSLFFISLSSPSSFFFRVVRTKAKELATLLRDKETLQKERADFYSLYSHEFSRSSAYESAGDPPPYDSKESSQADLGERRGHRRTHSQSSTSSHQSSHRRNASLSQTQQQQQQQQQPFLTPAQPPPAQEKMIKTQNTGPTVYASENKVPPIQAPTTPVKGRNTGSQQSQATASPTQRHHQDLRDDDFDPRAFAKASQPAPPAVAPQHLISPKVSGASAKTHLTGGQGDPHHPVQRKSSLYGKELALLQDMSDRSYESLLAKQSDATMLSDAFALETWRTKIKSFGWRGLWHPRFRVVSWHVF